MILLGLVGIALLVFLGIVQGCTADCGPAPLPPTLHVAQPEPSAGPEALLVVTAALPGLQHGNLSLLLENATLQRVDGPPGAGAWAARRSGAWLGPLDPVAPGDVLVVGGLGPIRGQGIRLVDVPCNCLLALAPSGLPGAIRIS